jgi:hypothetical protein
MEQRARQLGRRFTGAVQQGQQGVATCLNDKLSQLNATIRSYEQLMAEASEATEAGDSVRLENLRRRMETLEVRAGTLVMEADGCSGTESELVPDPSLSGPEQREWATRRLQDLHQVQEEVRLLWVSARQSVDTYRIACVRSRRRELDSIIADFESAETQHAEATGAGSVELRDQQFIIMAELAERGMATRREARRCSVVTDVAPAEPGGCCARSPGTENEVSALVGGLLLRISRG